MPESGRTQRVLSLLIEVSPQRIALGPAEVADNRRDRGGEQIGDRLPRLFDHRKP